MRASQVPISFQRAAKSGNGFAVDLADARFAEIENLRDFSEPHFFEVVHRENLLRYIGQLADSLSDKSPEFVSLQVVAAGAIGLVGERFVRRRPRSSITGIHEQVLVSREARLEGRCDVNSEVLSNAAAW